MVSYNIKSIILLEATYPEHGCKANMQGKEILSYDSFISTITLAAY